jgi:RHS repeat-associated protein
MSSCIRPLARLAALAVAFALPAAAAAQSSPSAYTSATRYDLAGHVTGTIAPDPDGAGSLHYAAVRNTYDSHGNLIKIETGELLNWQSEAVTPSAWNNFTIYTTTDTTYDALDRKLTVTLKGSDGVAVSLSQYGYDSVGRLQCTAVRMNPAAYGSLPAACALGTAGSYGPDRISKNVYDDAGQLVQVREAVGTSDEGSEVTYSYTANGKRQYVIDANGNRAQLTYDGYDRQASWIFPSPTRPSSFNDSTQATALSTAGSINSADHEDYTYDANGNRTSLRKRDGSDIGYTYDALNRVTVKDVDVNNERTDLAATYKRDVYYEYDARGLQTKARFDSLSGEGDTTTYDGFGRITSASETMDSQTRALSYLYDNDGDRTRLTWPDTVFLMYEYDGLDRVKDQRIQGGVLIVAPSYDSRGLISSVARYDTAQDQSFGYDPAARLSSLGIAGGGTSAPAVSWTFTRNPASQLTSEARDNDAYAWNGQATVSRAYSANGLNQYTAAGTAAFCYDANGNLTADGSSVYLYDLENRLVEKRVQTTGTCASLSYAGALQGSLRYDPTGRMHEVLGYTSGTLSSTTRFLHDGDAVVAEYNAGGTMQRRFVHGTGAGDDPLIWYEGTNASYTNARHLYADAHGSIVLVADYTGAAIATDTYDEYGIPGAANVGRFQYTGQAWLPEIGMYYYKARIYSPTLGRFLQTDPIGYDGGINIYAYVGNDPANRMDVTGMVRVGPWPPGDPVHCNFPDCPEGTPGYGGDNAKPSQPYSHTMENGGKAVYLIQENAEGKVVSFKLFATEGINSDNSAYLIVAALRILRLVGVVNDVAANYRAQTAIRQIMYSRGAWLRGKSLSQIESIFSRLPNWIRGIGRDGKSTVFRELNDQGNLTGRQVRFNPESTHHPDDAPYWTGNGTADRFPRYGAGE